MKLFFFLLIMLAASFHANSQSFSSETVATIVAKKMQDTLSINEDQKNGIYNANLLLHSWKMTARQQTSDMEILKTQLQAIENKRDSLYQQILTPGQYQLYKTRKPALIDAN